MHEDNVLVGYYRHLFLNIWSKNQVAVEQWFSSWVATPVGGRLPFF